MMKTSINEFIKNNLKVKVLSEDPLMKHMMTSSRLPHIVCVDGFEMSVQVGYSLYSEPKKIAKRYSKVEIGYPSEPEELIKEWAEFTPFGDEDEEPDYTDTVYPYVPVRIVDKVLKKHGGIDLSETLRRSDGLPEEVA